MPTLSDRRRPLTASQQAPNFDEVVAWSTLGSKVSITAVRSRPDGKGPSIRRVRRVQVRSSRNARVGARPGGPSMSRPARRFTWEPSSGCDSRRPGKAAPITSMCARQPFRPPSSIGKKRASRDFTSVARLALGSRSVRLSRSALRGMTSVAVRMISNAGSSPQARTLHGANCHCGPLPAPACQNKASHRPQPGLPYIPDESTATLMTTVAVP